MPKNFEEPYRYTQNRELSWLRFDRRVLEEAADPGVPALERLKFVSIFSSNLDEFFMVRVGSLFDLAHMTPDNTDNKTGWTPAEQLHHIYRVIPGLLAMKQQIYAAVIDDLARSGMQDVLPEALGTDDLKQINRFFKTELLPVLSPIVIGPNHPVPHLVNKKLYAAALLESKKGHKAVGIVPVPDSAPPYLLLTDGKRFVRTENILLRWLPTLFDAYTVQESCILAVTRNADISFDDEKFEDNEEDFRRQMKKLLKQRDHLAVVRLELSTQVSAEFQKALSALVRVQTHQVFVDESPLNMRYVFRLIGELPKEVSSRLLYSDYHPRWAEDLQHDQPSPLCDVSDVKTAGKPPPVPGRNHGVLTTLGREKAKHPLQRSGWSFICWISAEHRFLMSHPSCPYGLRECPGRAARETSARSECGSDQMRRGCPRANGTAPGDRTRGALRPRTAGRNSLK